MIPSPKVSGPGPRALVATTLASRNPLLEPVPGTVVETLRVRRLLEGVSTPELGAHRLHEVVYEPV